MQAFTRELGTIFTTELLTRTTKSLRGSRTKLPLEYFLSLLKRKMNAFVGPVKNDILRARMRELTYCKCSEAVPLIPSLF